jgi:hypothetical protein
MGRRLKTLLLVLALVLGTGCSKGSEQSLMPEAMEEKTPAPESWTESEGFRVVEGSDGFIELVPNKVAAWSTQADNYNPMTGDPGLDEFLLGCWLQNPPGPDRYEASPNVIYIPRMPQTYVVNNQLSDAQILNEIQKICEPPDGDSTTLGIPELFLWNSFGKQVPVFTILSLNDKPFRINDKVYFGEQWVTDSQWLLYDYLLDFSDYFDGKYGDTILVSQNVDMGDAVGFAYPLPRFRPPLPSAPDWVSTYAAVSHHLAMNGNNQLYGLPTINHELLHALGNLGDLYYTDIYDDGKQVRRDMIMPGTMAGSSTAPRHYVIGIHKAIYGWAPLLQIKYDTELLVLRNAGIPDASRECFYLGSGGKIGREFFTIENIGIDPQYEFSSGLFVAHVKLPRRYGKWPDISEDQTVPWCTWMNSWGFEPWEDSGMEWNRPFNKNWKGLSMLYPGELSGEFYNSFTESTIPNSRLWNGDDSGIRLTNITRLDAWNPAVIPAWFPTNIGETPPGPISLTVEVGRIFQGDCNGDGIVNQGDYDFYLANLGRRVGIEPMRVPIDTNGDGVLLPVTDRDADGVIATSERIYNDAGELVVDTGDWFDWNRDGVNDLDEDGNGVIDLDLVDADHDGFLDLSFAGEDATLWRYADSNGDGIINELDQAAIGYNWGELAFEEIWVPEQPIPSNFAAK